MDTIYEYDPWDIIDLECIGYKGYWLTRDARIWSVFNNRWKALDYRGCTVLMNPYHKYGRRLSAHVLAGQLFVVPELRRLGWEPIPIDPRYLINTEGMVYSTTHAVFLRWHLVMQYACVTLGFKHERVHRLVALTFIPNPNNYPEVNHKDGNKLNNCVSNLEWCDRSMNMKHAYQMGFLDDSLAKAQQARFAKK